MPYYSYLLLLLLLSLQQQQQQVQATNSSSSSMIQPSSQDHRRERQLQGEDPICFNGYVMDFFCINRGTLLDNNLVRTLEEPGRHTVHCLVDVERCINSGYELLLDPEEGSGNNYARAFRLDDYGNSRVLSVARNIGSCSTCTNGGTQTRGFRATVVGTMVPDSGIPPLLQVTELRTGPCDDGDQFVPANVTFDSGTIGDGSIDTVALHGGLMATAWGFVLPLGVLSSRFLRHRPGGLWFMMHRILNILGVVLTIVGIIVAFVSFDNVFSDGGGPSYKHGVMGLTTTSLGILQAVNGMARPHTPKEDEQKEKKRFVWEIVHKCTGYGTIALAYATIYYGAQVAGSKNRDTFMGVFYATFVFAGLVAIAMIGDKFLLSKKDNDSDKEYQKDKTEGLEVSNGFQDGGGVKDAKA